MQAQTSGAVSAPRISPEHPIPAPSQVPPARKRPSWIGWVIFLVLISGASVYWRQWTSQSAASPITIRTAQVVKGRLEAIVRLSGATAAENYSSLIAPQLRGSRSDRLRSFNAAPVTTTTSGVGTSSSGSSTSSTSTTSSSTTAGTGTAAAPGANTGAASGPGANMSTAMKAATSRFPDSSSTAATTAATGSASRTGSVMPTSETMGANGLGTTDSQLPGGPQGPSNSSGGMGDYMLVLEKAVPAGSHVKKGDTLAEFDRQYMLLRLDDYRASLLLSENSVNILREQLEVSRKAHDQMVQSAKGDLDKAELDMLKIPVLSQIDTERTKLARAEAEAKYKQLLFEEKYVDISAKAQLRASELDQAQTRIELRRAEMNADRLEVKAPIDGLVVMQNIFRGSELGQIQAGDQLYSGQPFMSIVDPASIIVAARVNQVDAERLRIGDKAQVHFDAYPDLDLPGRIYSIASIPKPGVYRSSFVGEIPVRIKLDKLDPRVIPDLSVSADVTVAAEPDAAVAPLAAIFRDGAAGDANPYVYVRTASGGFVRKDVELGLASNVTVAVRSGLAPDDIVALERPGTEGPAGDTGN